ESNNKNSCRIVVYSGNLDPEWEISESDASYLADIWENLEMSQKPSKEPVHLGYKGCIFKNDAGQTYYVYNGIVSLMNNGSSVHKVDSGRKFEKHIITLALETMLPLHTPKKITNAVND
ncbi:MAG: hypothetical protein LWX07_09295, partial [Bacteroidetes bacterium]|nr:hypothetical protein [Bacteroidota bacterium]